MVSRSGWLIGIALFVTGQVLAQEVKPASPPPAPADAGQPQSATPAPAPADAKPAPTEAAPSSAAPAASNPLAEGELDADKIMAAQKAGYTIKNENGQTLLCRRDAQTGSRLRHRTSCLTAREWEQLRAETELQLKALERRPRISPQ